MLKKITVEDRREMLVAELRKMGRDCWTKGAHAVPTTQAQALREGEPFCALGHICRLWSDQINWGEHPAQAWRQAARLVGFDDPPVIWVPNDTSKSPQEVADKLEKLFAGLPVAG